KGLGEGRIARHAEYPLRRVLTDHRTELESLGISAGDDPGVRHLRVLVDDEVPTRRRFVVAGVRLRDGRVLEQGEVMRQEPPRPVDARRVRPPVAGVGVLLLRGNVRLLTLTASASATATTTTTTAAASRAGGRGCCGRARGRRRGPRASTCGGRVGGGR